MKAQWREGNRVDLLENGEEFFPRVQQRIAEAKFRIYIETFILGEDCVGRELRDALCAAARRGVRVDVHADGFGSDPLSPEFVASLHEAGVRLHLFEPRRRIFGMRTNLFRRMHRKIALFDDRIAFIGGINFCADHLVERSADALQDFAAELEGPVVDDIRDFVERSASSPEVRLRRRWWRRRARIAGTTPTPASEPAGEARVKFVTRDNVRHRSDIEREYRVAIRVAQREVMIANAYFFPGYRLLRDMRHAARRGVKVTLVVQGKPDMPIVTIAARWLYQFLVPVGVRVLEFCQRPLHAKVAVVDGRWSTIGSSNLDPLSLFLNLEANVVIDDERFQAELRARLQHLIDESCTEVTAEQVPPRTAWRAATGWMLFHLLRHFPRWAGWLPAHRPRIEPGVPGQAHVGS